MALTREHFDKRVKELTEGLENLKKQAMQIQQTLIATDGALQDAQWHLDQFDAAMKAAQNTDSYREEHDIH